MRRGLVALTVTLTVLASVGAGVGAWLLVRGGGRQLPEISVYSNGRLERIGPFSFCDVHLAHCLIPETQGELAVSARNLIQLSVDEAIGRAPWRVLGMYRNSAAVHELGAFARRTALAVSVPPVDPVHGQLQLLVVQMLTLGADPAGEVHALPHAEWSVHLLWN